MKKLFMIVGIVSLAILGCKNSVNKKVKLADGVETSDSSVVDDQSPQNSSDWSGIYKGTTPCADCEGIKTVLELNQDNTYSLFLTYLGKPENNELKRTGNFTWEDDGSEIILKDNGEEMRYRVGENQLLMLDNEGNMIDGMMSDLYILSKNSK